MVGTSAIYSDITARKSMEAELHRMLRDQQRAELLLRDSRDRLRELSAALQTIREEEKTRIARELHDELGQALTALKMDTAAIAGEINHAQHALKARTDGMKQLIDTTVSAVWRISADLRPVMLDNLGLVPTLEWLTREFSKRTGIRVDLNISDEDLSIGGDAATAIFRIVQEALTKVARHAGAHEVAVEVILNDGTVVVRVRDDGKGMAAQDTHKVRSFGLLGMRERAYVLGGELKVGRAPQWDVLVTDMSMPGRSGIELIKLVKKTCPKLPVLVLSMYGEAQYAVRAIHAGASGYLNKESASGQLVATIRIIAAGGVHVSAGVAEALFNNVRGGNSARPHE